MKLFKAKDASLKAACAPEAEGQGRGRVVLPSLNSADSVASN
jgi:hypothetical protein